MDKYIEHIVRAIFITDNRVMIVTELLFTPNSSTNVSHLLDM